MSDIFDIRNDPIFDDRIEVYTYNPFANTTFGHSNEIRILIQQENLFTLLFTLPCEGFLYIEGKLTKSQTKESRNLM